MPRCRRSIGAVGCPDAAAGSAVGSRFKNSDPTARGRPASSEYSPPSAPPEARDEASPRSSRRRRGVPGRRLCDRATGRERGRCPTEPGADTDTEPARPGHCRSRADAQSHRRVLARRRRPQAPLKASFRRARTSGHRSWRMGAPHLLSRGAATGPSTTPSASTSPFLMAGQNPAGIGVGPDPGASLLFVRGANLNDDPCRNAGRTNADVPPEIPGGPDRRRLRERGRGASTPRGDGPRRRNARRVLREVPGAAGAHGHLQVRRSTAPGILGTTPRDPASGGTSRSSMSAASAS